MRRRLWLRAAVLQLGTFALCLAAEPPLRLTPREAGFREPPDFAPLYAGKNVIVRGVVSAPFLSFPGYALLPFEDARYGTVLEVVGDGHELQPFHQGDEIEALGVVSSHAGMVTIRPEGIRWLAHQTPPTPETVPPEAILDFRHLGRPVRTQARITEIGETTAGAYLSLATAKGEFRLLIPHGRGVRSASLAEYSVGDKIEATGVALQYCTTPPYDRWFELLVSDPRYITRTEKARSVPLAAIVAGGASLVLLGLVLWTRERRLRSQREHLRRTYQLGEQILGASSSEAVVAEIAQGMPALLGISRVNMYVYNRATKALDAIFPGDNQVLSVSLSEPPGGAHAGVVACFHYKTLLAIPDIGRSPFPIAPPGKTRPKSLMFVPMLAQGEVIGVLELDRDDRTHDFTADEQTLAQHLANQVGVAVRLLDQRSVQEQLFRTEKLAAVGRLISGVVNQLLTPLASISELADRALVKSRLTPSEREVLAIAAEAQKASSIVARLVSFATAEQGEARPVAVTTLIRNLIEFRERDWKASGIRVSDLTSPEPMFVLGSYGQLEQAFLTLFVYAEQSLVDVPQRSITIRTSPLGRRLLVEIGFSAPPDRRAPQETAAVLGVTRSVIAGHGGEVRLVEKNNAEPRFEVELPLSARERGGIASPASKSPRDAGRHATALLIEAEEPQQKQFLDLLAAQGYRVVPVSNADTGLELAQRMRFEVAFCSLHAPGLNWVELSERLQTRVGAFVLLSDRYDAELAADFEGDGRFVLNKPVQEADLARVLSAIESSAPDSATRPAVEPGARGPERGRSPKPN